MKPESIMFISIIIGILGLYVIPLGVFVNNDSILSIGLILEVITILGLVISLQMEYKHD